MCCSGWAVRRPSTSELARLRCRPRSCSRRRKSTSRSLAPARRAQEIPRGAWAMSTRSSASPARTCRRSTAPGSRRSSPPARTASTRWATSTPTSVVRTRSFITPSSWPGSCAKASCLRRRATARSPTTTRATSRATTTSARNRASSSMRWAGRWRCRATGSGPSAAGRGARECGWRRSAGAPSTRSGCAKRPPRAPKPSRSRVPSAR